MNIKAPKREFYSQNDEEYYILKYFGDKIGTFLDIGAWWGWELSNTYRLVLAGWGGVCVEPSPESLVELKETHDGNDKVKILNVAISTSDGKSLLYTSKDGSGTTDSLFREFTASRGVVSGCVEVETLTPKSLIQRVGLKDVDFCSIDVESDELGLYITQELSEIIRPSLWCVENTKYRRELICFLMSIGYKKIHQTPENVLMGV